MTAVRTCLTEKYASFQGRARRSEYWWFILFVVILCVVSSLIWWVLYLLVSLALLAPALGAGFRRLQDTGRPGWYILIPFGLSVLTSLLAPTLPDPDTIAATGELPDMGGTLLFSLLSIVQLVISLVFLWWLTRPSQPETNAYGPPPV
ncbi:DUF805 domain-containing protein [Tateyamaria armeniaca]|uniref:DUF805 domain-containing protein n=1 Tax=Tateyamaria armeniaca TaxID=2518930 RepID=A0ABW8UNV0_9RHOB